VFGAQRSKFGKPQDRPVWQRAQGDPTTRQPVDNAPSVENSLFPGPENPFSAALRQFSRVCGRNGVWHRLIRRPNRPWKPCGWPGVVARTRHRGSSSRAMGSGSRSPNRSAPGVGWLSTALTMRSSTASTKGCGVDARNANGAGSSDGDGSWPATRP